MSVANATGQPTVSAGSSSAVDDADVAAARGISGGADRGDEPAPARAATDAARRAGAVASTTSFIISAEEEHHRDVVHARTRWRR